jgi:hypothetical protein
MPIIPCLNILYDQYSIYLHRDFLSADRTIFSIDSC